MHHPSKKILFRILGSLILFLSFFSLLSPPCLAGESKFEVQFGAFTIKAAAAALVNDLKEFDPDLHISSIKNKAGQSFFTVRSGGFDTLERAVSYRDSFVRLKKGEAPFVMVLDSMEQVEIEEKPVETNPVEPEQIEAEPVEAEPDNPKPDLSESDEVLTPAVEVTPGQDSDAPGLDDPWGAADSEAAATPAMDLPSGPTASPEKVSVLEQEIATLKDQVKMLLDAEDIRSELTESKEEKDQKEDDILNAAGRNYTLLQKGKVGVEYKFAYTYYAYDSVKQLNIIEHNSNHNITNTFTIEYPLMDNLTLEAVLPFVYEYDEVGGDDSKSVTDFGDVSFGASLQPLKSGGKIPSMIVNTTVTCPMGRNPYEVNPLTELSTGSGGYSVSGSLSMSKPIDPIMAFGTLSYTYKHPIKDLDYKIGSYTLEQYDRGDSLGFSLGLGYALSYKTSLSLGYSYAHTFKSTRYYREANPVDYGAQTSSSISIGTSWRMSPKFRLNMSLGIGLGNSDYFSLSFRFPFEFNL